MLRIVDVGSSGANTFILSTTLVLIFCCEVVKQSSEHGEIQMLLSQSGS